MNGIKKISSIWLFFVLTACILAKPNIWIHTDATAVTGYTKNSTEAKAITDQNSDPDDQVALTQYLMLAYRFNTVKIVMGVTTRNTQINPVTTFDNIYRPAYAQDIQQLNQVFGGQYPPAESFDVVESSCTAGSNVIQFTDSPDTQYDNYNNLPGTVKMLVDELKKSQYSYSNPLYLCVWGPMTEAAMAVKHLVRTNQTTPLSRLFIVSHWHSSYTNQQNTNNCYSGTEAVIYGCANCNDNCQACRYVRNQAKLSGAAFRWVDLASVGQTGIVNGFNNFFNGVDGSVYNQFEESRLGELFVKSKFVYGKPDGSDCATFYTILGDYGVQLSDYNNNGQTTSSQENDAKNTYLAYGHAIAQELLDISDIAAAADTTPPAAPTGLQATPGDGQVSLDWNDNTEPDLDRYAVHRGTSSGNLSWYQGSISTSNWVDTNVTNGTTYYYAIEAIDTSNNRSDLSAEDSATPSAGGGTLPAPWQNQDIGSTGAAGDAEYASGIFTVEGAGADIWGTADAFHFVHQPWDENVEVIAKVNSLGNTNSWAKAGVMIRESLAAGSKHAMMVVTPGNGTSFQRRTTTDGTSAHTTPQDGVSAPYWVRVIRDGSTLTGYKSANGTDWTAVGSATISMNNSVYVGLAVTSHNNGVLTTAAFSNVQVGVISTLGLEDFENFTITEALQGEPMLTYNQAVSLGLDAGGWIFTADDSGFAVRSSGGPDGSAYIAREDSSQAYARGFAFVIRDNYQTTGIQPLEFDYLFREVGGDPANGGGMAVRATGINPSSSWTGVLDGNGGSGQYGADYAARYRPEPDPVQTDAIAADGTYLLKLTDRDGDFASSSSWQYKAVNVDLGTGYEWIVVHFGHNFQSNGLGVADPHLYFGIDNVTAPFLP